jgi:hypothetical protein
MPQVGATRIPPLPQPFPESQHLRCRCWHGLSLTAAGRLPRDGKDVKELKDKVGVGAVVTLNEAGDHFDQIYFSSFVRVWRSIYPQQGSFVMLF